MDHLTTLKSDKSRESHFLSHRYKYFISIVQFELWRLHLSVYNKNLLSCQISALRPVFQSLPILRSYRIIFIILLLLLSLTCALAIISFASLAHTANFNDAAVILLLLFMESCWLTFSAVSRTGSSKIARCVHGCCAVDSARRKENGAKLCQIKLKPILFLLVKEIWSETTTSNNKTPFSPEKSSACDYYYFIIATTK